MSMLIAWNGTVSSRIDSEVSVPPRAPDRASLASSMLSEQVTQKVVKGILRGDLHTGGLLPSEKELARQFVVSRSVAREAVHKVAMLGLIERRRGPRTANRLPVESRTRAARSPRDLRCCCRGDVDAARQAMSDHLLWFAHLDSEGTPD